MVAAWVEVVVPVVWCMRREFSCQPEAIRGRWEREARLLLITLLETTVPLLRCRMLHLEIYLHSVEAVEADMHLHTQDFPAVQEAAPRVE